MRKAWNGKIILYKSYTNTIDIFKINILEKFSADMCYIYVHGVFVLPTKQKHII